MHSAARWLRVSAGVLILLALCVACGREARPAATPPAGKSGPAQASAVSAAPREPDAVEYAIRFAADFDVDEDAVLTQSKVLEKVAQAALRRQETDRAFGIARKIRGWERGTACADVARAYALAGRSNDAHRALLEAEAWCALIRERTRESSMGWETGRIRQHIVAARGELGETNTLEYVQRPFDNASATAISSLLAGGTNQSSAAFLQQLSAIMTNKDFEVQQGLSLGILQWAGHYSDLSTQAVEEVAAVVKTSLRFQPESMQVIVQQELIRFLAAHGQSAAVEAEIREMEQLARSLPAGHSRGTALADVAATLRLLDPKRAALLLSEAREEIGRAAASSQAYGYAHVAGRCLMSGETNTASQLFLQALDAATQMQSNTPRLQRLVEVCAMLAESRLPLAPTLRRQLDELVRREEPKPAHVK